MDLPPNKEKTRDKVGEDMNHAAPNSRGRTDPDAAVSPIPEGKGYTPPENQKLVPLAQAAQFLPHCPHPNTLHRWRLNGVRGVKLRTVRLGGRHYTCQVWVDEFVAALNSRPPAPVSRPDHQAACWKLGI
jgi:hypothetical protein